MAGQELQTPDMPVANQWCEALHFPVTPLAAAGWQVPAPVGAFVPGDRAGKFGAAGGDPAGAPCAAHAGDSPLTPGCC